MAAITYKCPHCGGAMVFRPESQTYQCPYCLSDLSLSELEAAEAEGTIPAAGKTEPGGQPPVPVAAEPGGQPSVPVAAEPGGQSSVHGSEGSGEHLSVSEKEELNTYTCPSCGAEIVADKTTAATFCYYCHNPVLIEGRLEGSYHPDYVIPFKIGREKAEEIFGQWIGRKRYAPSGFYSRQQIGSMTGVYFPYWLYCCQVDGKLEAKGIRLRMWDAGGRRYTEKKVYHVSRDGQMQIDHIARNALKKANGQLSQGVLPFRTEEVKPFHMSYLSGFMAEKRDVEKQELAADVEAEARELAAAALRESAGEYAELAVQQQRTDIRDAKWYYSLLPVWTLTYKGPGDGKIYYFALNGQTGKTCGEVPVDRKKLLLLFLTVFFPLFAILLFLMGRAAPQWYEALLALGASGGIAGSLCWNVVRQYGMKELTGTAARLAFRPDSQFAFREQTDELVDTIVTHIPIPQQAQGRGQGRS